MKKELDIINLKKEKVIALLAPSFAAEFEYPKIISQLKSLGFKKVVELTFGAKMINREYHKQLKTSKFLISSVCPGILFTLQKTKFSKYLAKIDSPMIATAKICKKTFQDYKTCFISPCSFKKLEADSSKHVDYYIDYQRLKQLFKQQTSVRSVFSCFINEYTRIYPLSGGLSKTAHLKNVLKPGEEKVIDGIQEVNKFLKKPLKNVKFLDCTFCKGGCIGGPFISSKNLENNKKKVLHYIKIAKRECIPKKNKGLVIKAKGINF